MNADQKRDHFSLKNSQTESNRKCRSRIYFFAISLLPTGHYQEGKDDRTITRRMYVTSVCAAPRSQDMPVSPHCGKTLGETHKFTSKVLTWEIVIIMVLRFQKSGSNDQCVLDVGVLMRKIGHAAVGAL